MAFVNLVDEGDANKPHGEYKYKPQHDKRASLIRLVFVEYVHESRLLLSSPHFINATIQNKNIISPASITKPPATIETNSSA